jgi:hypothetical protein
MKASVEGYCTLQRFSGGPSWRWQLAKQLAADSSCETGRVVDRYVLDAREYLIERGRDPEKEEWTPELSRVAAAEALTKELSICDALKVLVLGDCPVEDIARRLESDAAVIATWELLFFDVREALAASDWIASRVIRPEQDGGNAELAAQLKTAYAGGAQAATAVLDAGAGKICQQGQRLFERKMQLNLKMMQALEVPLHTDRDRMRFMHLHVELWKVEQWLDVERHRLEHRSRELLYKQTAAEARLEQAQHRQQQKAEAAVERKRRAILRQEEREARRQGLEIARSLARKEDVRIAQECLASSALAQLNWVSSAGSSKRILPLAS